MGTSPSDTSLSFGTLWPLLNVEAIDDKEKNAQTLTATWRLLPFQMTRSRAELRLTARQAPSSSQSTFKVTSVRESQAPWGQRRPSGNRSPPAFPTFAKEPGEENQPLSTADALRRVSVPLVTKREASSARVTPGP